MLEEAKTALETKKIEFRENAISKLTFLYPDVKFCMNFQSMKFAAFSATKDSLITGSFMDGFLPDLLDLEEVFHDARFEESVKTFRNGVSSFTFPKPVLIDGQRRKFSKLQFESFLDSESAKVGYSVSNQYERAYEIRLYKNDKIVGRTSKFSPKPEGYLAEKVYKHVVQDLNGPGVSCFSIDLGVYTAGTVGRTRVDFLYLDSPRKTEGQSRDHYLGVCSQFLPFLNEIENHVVDRSDVDYIFGPDEEDLDDKAIGLR